MVLRADSWFYTQLSIIQAVLRGPYRMMRIEHMCKVNTLL